MSSGLDWNVKLEKEYQHMMLASLVFASWETQIANELKTISEYGRSNLLYGFQLIW
jgi:hypothetical protein